MGTLRRRERTPVPRHVREQEALEKRWPGPGYDWGWTLRDELASGHTPRLRRQREAVTREEIAWGHTPRTHLAWLLDRIVYADLDTLQTEEDREDRLVALLLWLRAQVRVSLWATWENESKWAAATPEGFYALVQRPLREALGKLLAEPAAAFDHPFSGLIRFRLVQYDATRWVVDHSIASSISEIAVGALLMAVSRVPPPLLRACRWPQCGRIFLASKSQQMCRAHQAEARRLQLRTAQQRHRAKVRRERKRR